MVQAGKRDRSAFKSSKREQVKLKKRNLKKGKLKEERSDTQSPEIDQICSGNIDDLQITKKGKQATAAEEARNKLMLKKEKRREKVSQGDLDSNKQKKRREKMSQHDLDNTKKKKRREKKTEGKLMKAARRKKKEVRGEKSIENNCDAEEETVEEISSVDEDYSRGMKRRRTQSPPSPTCLPQHEKNVP